MKTAKIATSTKSLNQTVSEEPTLLSRTQEK